MRRITWSPIAVIALGLLAWASQATTQAQQPATRPEGTSLTSHIGEILSNGGFESGDFGGWPGVSTGGVPATVLSGSAHSGSFFARTGQFLYTKHYKVMPSTVYSLSAWYKTIFPSVVIGTLTIKLDWHNASDAYISESAVFTESNIPRTSWTLVSGSATSPTIAAYANVYFDYFGVLDSYIELDDVSVIGLIPDSFGLYLPLVARQ
jgi:hypothetical protein